MTSRTKRNENNATRRFARSYRKQSEMIRQIAAELMAAKGIDLGHAMNEAVRQVAAMA